MLLDNAKRLADKGNFSEAKKILEKVEQSSDKFSRLRASKAYVRTIVLEGKTGEAIGRLAGLFERYKENVTLEDLWLLSDKKHENGCIICAIIYYYFIALCLLLDVDDLKPQKANDQVCRIKNVFLQNETSKTVKNFCLEIMKEIYAKAERSLDSISCVNTLSLMLYRIAHCEFLSGNFIEAKLRYQQVCKCLEAEKLSSSLYLSSLVNYALCLRHLNDIKTSQEVLVDASNILQNMPADVKFSEEEGGRVYAEELIKSLQGGHTSCPQTSRHN